MFKLYTDGKAVAPKTKKATKKPKAIALEVCPDNEPTLADIAQAQALLERAGKVAVTTPVVKAPVSFAKAKPKRKYALKEQDTVQSPKQNWAIRQALGRLIAEGKIDPVSVERSPKGFPTGADYKSLTYNQSFELLSKLNAM